MLELGYKLQELRDLVGPLACEVELPASWRQGPSPGAQLVGKFEERRRHPRYAYRACAALQHRQTFPSYPRESRWHLVYTKDLSRGGLSFYHSEPLFPRERMRIVLPQHGMCTIEVVWCGRIQARCFQIGARFVERYCSAETGAGAPAATAET